MTSAPTLTNMSPQATQALADRIGSVCVVFHDQSLPAGCTPATADLGIETAPSGQVRLLVVHGVTYTGTNADVRRWIGAGRRDFADLHAALNWLAEVSPAPRPTATRSLPTTASGQRAPAGRGTAAGRRDPRTISNLDEVAVEAHSTAVPAQVLREGLTREVVGQDEAVADIAEAVARHTAKEAPTRPLTILLAGPTGVGKTLTSTTLSSLLTEHGQGEWTHHRIDMAEYSERHSVSRLHGAPPGYLGYGDDRNLSAILRADRPAVIVFDEIDKAHPEVFRTLLGLMDAGRLGSVTGPAVHRSILLFTSNAGADDLLRIDRNRQPAQVANEVTAVLTGVGIPPEIVGRLALVSVFRPLTTQARAHVAVLAVQRVSQAYGIDIAWIDPEVITRLLADTARTGLGARALEHAADRHLGTTLAGYHGQGPVHVRIDGDAVAIAPAPIAASGTAGRHVSGH